MSDNPEDWTREELIERYNKMKELATIDSLTGVINRLGLYGNDKILGAFPREVSNAIRNELDLSVVFYDVDNFGQFNKVYGEQTGDSVLREIAQTPMYVLRNTDINGRHGGEEFVIIMPSANKEIAYQKAERIRKKVNEISVPTNKGSIDKLSISMGIASLLEDEKTKLLAYNHTMKSRSDTHFDPAENISKIVELLIDNSDTAMRLAKSNGKNRTIIYNENLS